VSTLWSLRGTMGPCATGVTYGHACGGVLKGRTHHKSRTQRGAAS
jgi:hypothetical protein